MQVAKQSWATSSDRIENKGQTWKKLPPFRPHAALQQVTFFPELSIINGRTVPCQLYHYQPTQPNQNFRSTSRCVEGANSGPHLFCRCAHIFCPCTFLPSHCNSAKRSKQVLGRWTAWSRGWWVPGIWTWRLWWRRRSRRGSRRRRRSRWWRRWWRLGHGPGPVLRLPFPINQSRWLGQRGKSRDHLLLFHPLQQVAVAKVSCRLGGRHLGCSYGADNETDTELKVRLFKCVTNECPNIIRLDAPITRMLLKRAPNKLYPLPQPKLTRMSAENTWPSSCTKLWWASRGNCQTWSTFNSAAASASSVPKSCKRKSVTCRSLVNRFLKVWMSLKLSKTSPSPHAESSVKRSDVWSIAKSFGYSSDFITGSWLNGISGVVHLLKKVSPPKNLIVDFAVWSPLKLLRTNLSSTRWPNARLPRRIRANMSEATASKETTASDWRPKWSLRLTISKADLVPTWHQTESEHWISPGMFVSYALTVDWF